MGHARPDTRDGRHTRPVAWGEWLQRYRLAAGQSQKALSARAGLSARTISALERGIMERPYEDTVALP